MSYWCDSVNAGDGPIQQAKYIVQLGSGKKLQSLTVKSRTALPMPSGQSSRFPSEHLTG
jgi:hypothetical protein